MIDIKATFLLLVSVAALWVFFIPCSGQAEKPDMSRSDGGLLGPRNAWALIQKNKNNPRFVILDIRTPAEFMSGHIEGAININYNAGHFRTELSRLDPKKTYFVYCRTGRRTAEAMRIMGDLGFNSIIRMRGDIVGWRSQNLPLVRLLFQRQSADADQEYGVRGSARVSPIFLKTPGGKQLSEDKGTSITT
jgi:rhodanese-related sulfurtransferase